MSGRVVSADVVNGLKNSSSYEPTGEKIKVKVYVNQQNSVSEYTEID